MSLHLLLMAAPQAQPGAPNPLVTFLPLILVFVIFWFLIIRPQRKREQERQAMIGAAKKGDRIITAGGLHGKIVQVDDTSVLVEIDTNTKVRLEKTAIGSVQGDKA